MIPLSEGDYIACICEGSSEMTVMDLLLNKDALLFDRERLLDGKVLSNRFFRDPRLFSDRYLTMDYRGGKIRVMLIQDRKGVGYAIKNPYLEKVRDFIYVVTAPEIEMLMIHSLGLYTEYKKQESKKKPSNYLAEKLKTKTSTIKSRKYIESFYSSHDLIAAVETHKSKSQKMKSEVFLADLLS